MPTIFDKNWPTVEPPTPEELHTIREAMAERGGRFDKTPHSDRAMSVKVGNKRERFSPAECRRQAVVFWPYESDAVEACINCDSIHLWPRAQEILS